MNCMCIYLHVFFVKNRVSTDPFNIFMGTFKDVLVLVIIC